MFIPKDSPGSQLFEGWNSTHRTGTHPEQPLPSGHQGMPLKVGHKGIPWIVLYTGSSPSIGDSKCFLGVIYDGLPIISLQRLLFWNLGTFIQDEKPHVGVSTQNFGNPNAIGNSFGKRRQTKHVREVRSWPVGTEIPRFHMSPRHTIAMGRWVSICGSKRLRSRRSTGVEEARHWFFCYGGIFDDPFRIPLKWAKIDVRQGFQWDLFTVHGFTWGVFYIY